MILPIVILFGIVLVFALAGGALFFLKEERLLRLVPLAAALLVALLVGGWLPELYRHGVITFCYGRLLLDKLALFYIALVNFIFIAAALYAINGSEGSGTATEQDAITRLRRRNGLWLACHAMLLLVLLADSVALAWAGYAAATLPAALLSAADEKRGYAVMAVWNYLLPACAGLVLAFVGTVLVIAAAYAQPYHELVYSFSELRGCGARLNSSLLLLSFLFIAVGLGVNVGLAPMHGWLPDIYERVPTALLPIVTAARFNCAIFVITRYLTVVDADGRGRGHAVLIFLGLASIIVAALFGVGERNLKRLLAHCSLEHVGIITLCFGIGGFGTVIALLHTVNQTMAKLLALFSAASISEQYGTSDRAGLSGAVKLIPAWGALFLLAMLALLGVAPSALFFSQLLLVKLCFSRADYLIMAAFILGHLVIFVPALKFTVAVVYGRPATLLKRTVAPPALRLWPVIAVAVAELVIFGLWLPLPLLQFLQQAAAVIEHGVKL